MAKDHGPSVKDDKQYEGLRKKGMSKSRAAAIANTPDASSKGGKRSGSGQSSSQRQEEQRERQRRQPGPEAGAPAVRGARSQAERAVRTACR